MGVSTASARFRPAVKEPQLQKAFDALIQGWSGGSAAMKVSDILRPLNAMNLLATVLAS